MKEFWNDRYLKNEYVYGTLPNVYFAEKIKDLSVGKILLPAEGEGRNAIFASESGWNVKAFDQSYEAMKKANNLAKIKKLNINYVVSDIETYEDVNDSYDCIALIYNHFNQNIRQEYHRKLIQYLKPGGILILEAFSKKQINNDSGGPKNIDMLFSKEELTEDFESLKISDIEEIDIILNEGIFHRGKASVIRMIAERN